MEHVIIYFKHDMKDIIPYSEAVRRMRRLLTETETGDYLEDDMAIDGGDAEAMFCGRSAEALFETISPVLKMLPFMRGAKVTFVYGPLDSGQREKEFEYQF